MRKVKMRTVVRPTNFTHRRKAPSFSSRAQSMFVIAITRRRMAMTRKIMLNNDIVYTV